jgi:hypothetical protein
MPRRLAVIYNTKHLFLFIETYFYVALLFIMIEMIN